MSSTSWIQLQNELRDLAFLLDRRGNHAAAELAATIAARIGELLEAELSSAAPATLPTAAGQR